MAPLGAILLALAATCAAPADRALVGLWETATPGVGGAGHTLEFRADGTMISAFAIVLQFAYSFDRGTLFTADNATALAAEVEGPRIEIEGNVLVLTDAKGGSVRKERVGPVEDPGRPIVGVWRYRHDRGPMAYERYTADGQLSFRMPLSSNHGCYTLTGGTLTVDVDAKPAKFTPRLEGDALELKREGHPSSHYRRAPSVWYPRE